VFCEITHGPPDLVTQDDTEDIPRSPRKAPGRKRIPNESIDEDVHVAKYSWPINEEWETLSRQRIKRSDVQRDGSITVRVDDPAVRGPGDSQSTTDNPSSIAM
jgi:hypothetical protein